MDKSQLQLQILQLSELQNICNDIIEIESNKQNDTELVKLLKKEIIYKCILPELGSSDTSSLQIDYQYLSKDIRREIDQVIEQDTDPGYRTIQMKLLSIVNRVRLENKYHTQLRTTTRNGEENIKQQHSQ